MGLVSIGSDADTLIAAIGYELQKSADRQWLQAVDEYLADKSWQDTFTAMVQLMLTVRRQDNPVVLVTELKNAS
jgi:UDP-galactopyranose mutase